MQIEQEELNNLVKIREKYTKLIIDLGQIELEMLELQQSKTNISNIFSTIKQEETLEMNKIKEKYGNGEVNIETGEFSLFK